MKFLVDEQLSALLVEGYLTSQQSGELLPLRTIVSQIPAP